MVEELMRAQADSRRPDLDAALEHLLSSGGKRIRPTVALLTGGMLGGASDRIITLAAAIELLHTATLVHDDLIDGAFLRRGIATLNSRWSPAATVLTGDFIFARAARLAAQTNSVEAMHLFAETLATIVNGEITQLFSSPGLVSRANYDQRIYAKTASLFELATTAAAMLSLAGQETIEAMRSFGYSIGMAFQIVDDILDFTGEQATVGKPVASDLRQGLVTLPALYYLEGHPDDPDMKIVLAGDRVSEVVIERLVASIRKSGAIHRALDDAQEFVRLGLEILSTLPDSIERRALEDLGHYIVNRQL
ncbi:MAG: polyprenyl synthetase family protein [Anaerolineales bacterium]|nr:polyprenyl synthetase family protein [Anaerolineales bacterium]